MEEEQGSLVLGAEPADWAPSPPCCQFHPWDRPHSRELAVIGSLDTGKEAEGEMIGDC